MSSPHFPQDEFVQASGPRLCRDGSISLSRNHLVLLQGLLDRPNATAVGRWDWVATARPYIQRYRGTMQSNWVLYHAIDSLPREWVARRRRGRFMSYRLLEGGRAILEGRVPARVSGRYPYQPRGGRGAA
jgi:hypothetical protein